jgi:hypothetical protein
MDCFGHPGAQVVYQNPIRYNMSQFAQTRCIQNERLMNGDTMLIFIEVSSNS